MNAQHDPVKRDEARHYSELDQTAQYEEWAADRLEELKEQYLKSTPFSSACDCVDTALIEEKMDDAWRRINTMRNTSRPRELDFYAGRAMTEIMNVAADEWAATELEKEKQALNANCQGQRRERGE